MDRVLTVNDYYDGPRLGIAELDGVPHVYEAEFDHSADEYGDTYFLSPVDAAVMALVLEDWEIWLRWQAAYRRGETTADMHPALPKDRERHEWLQAAIGDRLRADPARSIYCRAKFSENGEHVVWERLTKADIHGR